MPLTLLGYPTFWGRIYYHNGQGIQRLSQKIILKNKIFFLAHLLFLCLTMFSV